MQLGWPVVALVATLLGAIVAVLALVPASDQRGQTIITIIASALASLLAGLFTARRAENAVAQQQSAPELEQGTEAPPAGPGYYAPYQPPGGPEYPERRP